MESVKTCQQKCACNPYDLHGDQALRYSLKAMTKKQTFSPNKLITFLGELNYFNEVYSNCVTAALQDDLPENGKYFTFFLI